MNWCDDEYEHRRNARNDANRGYYDREYYDRYAERDSCEYAYTKEYDHEKRRIAEREEEYYRDLYE